MDISSDFLSLIALLVFLEIIELNFCQYNKDLRISIMDRSKDEFKLFDFPQSEENIKEKEENQEDLL